MGYFPRAMVEETNVYEPSPAYSVPAQVVGLCIQLTLLCFCWLSDCVDVVGYSRGRSARERQQHSTENEQLMKYSSFPVFVCLLYH